MASLYFDYGGDIPDELTGPPESVDERSLAPRDLMVPSKQLESADWLNDLHEEIEWMREMLSAEIDQGYSRVCKLLSEMPESGILMEDKRFLDFAKQFLTLTRDDKIKLTRKESFDIVKRIKSFVLNLRSKKCDERSEEKLSGPICLDETAALQLWLKDLVIPRLANKTACSVSSEHPSAGKWPRLTRRHDAMYKKFQILKREFLHIVTLANRMYSKLALEKRKKYLPLAQNFAHFLKFLRYSSSDLLLISEDQFDYYARKIRKLVTGVALTESRCLKGSSTYASQPTSSLPSVIFGGEKADWKEDMLKEIELARETELLHITELYQEVYFKYLNRASEAERKELKEQKRSLKLAMEFLDLTREDEIEWSWDECYNMMTSIKLYALRYRNDYLAEQWEEQQQLKVGVWTDPLDQSLGYASGSEDSTISIGGLNNLDSYEDLHKEIEWTRKEYLSEIEEIYRRICKNPAKFKAERRFVESALELLTVTRNDRIIRPKNLCLLYLEKIKEYGLSCKNVINAEQSA